ncbi:MAG: 3,4-dihydroxy-2-butanone-4-phosphate synthase [Candidatus Nanohaloarchaea archaeon]|nr:3,4-dihydroxy-2-butanone-4-phosphate synthase [Candidatus Nanohaloarchaea archaeon]
MGLAEAVAAVQRGEPVLVHDADDREDETDLVVPAAAVDWTDVRRLRTDAGGLICVAVPHGAGHRFDLPLLDDLFEEYGGAPDYDDRSSFSVSVNHVSTRTGITDRDRATTIRALADAVSDPAFRFRDEFRAPGHVPVLLEAAEGLAERQGHTELAVDLLRRADVTPAAVVCEMLDDETGNALSAGDAGRYAEENGFAFLEADELLDG